MEHDPPTQPIFRRIRKAIRVNYTQHYPDHLIWNHAFMQTKRVAFHVFRTGYKGRLTARVFALKELALQGESLLVNMTYWRHIEKVAKWFQRKKTLTFGELDMKKKGQAHFRYQKQSCRLIGLADKRCGGRNTQGIDEIASYVQGQLFVLLSYLPCPNTILAKSGRIHGNWTRKFYVRKPY